MAITIDRREFIMLFGGGAAVWPRAAYAQQPGRVRRVAALILGAENDPVIQSRVATLRGTLQSLGWIEGRNLQIDLHITDDPIRLGAYAQEVVNSAPDVIFAGSGVATREIQRRTQTIPIVFSGGGDPVKTGLVRNVAQPEGNTTGFANAFNSLGGKWLQLLKEAAPRVTRVAIIFDPERSLGGFLDSIDAAAAELAVTVIRVPVRNGSEIERAIETFAAEPNGGLIIPGVPPSTNDFRAIRRLALQHRLPLVFQGDEEGVLISYHVDSYDLARGAASYIDHILRGAKPSELPVQYPTKFRLVINLKTAKAIGLTIPDTLLLRADRSSNDFGRSCG
jgi:putative tryptophan/tyrosine transport system substrate-binding protein